MLLRIFSFFIIAITILLPWQVTHADFRSDIAQQLDATAGEQGGNLGEPTDPRVVVSLLIRGALTLLGTVMLVYIFWSGFLWMTAAGDEDRISKAKKGIVRAATGLIIILSAYAITLFVTTRLVELRDGPANQRFDHENPDLDIEQRQYINPGLEEDATPFAI